MSMIQSINTKSPVFILTLLLCLLSMPAMAKMPTPPKGIFVLSKQKFPASEAPMPDYIDGYTMRIGWRDMEKSPGIYNFSRIIDNIEYLQGQGKRLNLEIFAAMAPDDLTLDEAQTFPMQLGQFNGNAPLPWNEPAMLRWEKFLQALANTPVYELNSKAKIPLKDHPTLVMLDAPILGLQGIRNIKGEVTGHADYTREKLITAITRSIHASRNAFPHDYGFTAFFKIKDSDIENPLDEAIYEALKTEFMDTDIGLGLMQELWSDTAPMKDKLGKFLARVEAPNIVVLQALTSWAKPFSKNSTATASGNPAFAFQQAWDQYHVRFFEIYPADVIAFPDILQEWSAKIKSD